MGAAMGVTSRRDVVPALVSSVVRASSGGGSTEGRRIVVASPAGGGRSYTLRQLVAELRGTAREATAVESESAKPFALVCGLLGVVRPARVPAAYVATLVACAEELSAQEPLILVVDDFHHADAESIEVLAELTTSPGLAVVVVASVLREHGRPVVARFLEGSAATLVALPAFDTLDLDVLVNERTGNWPGPQLRTLLAQVAMNALQVVGILSGLTSSGGVAVANGTLELAAGNDAPLSSSANLTQTPVSLVGIDLDLARALSAWGGPAGLADIAGVLGVPAGALIGPTDRLLSSGMLRSVGEDVVFAQDSVRQAVYDATPAPIRAVLHQAAAEASAGSSRARHVVASGAEPDSMLAAIADAVDDLGNAPAVTAELLTDAASATAGGTAAAARLAATRARALARSGQPGRAAEVAVEALGWDTDLETHAELRRVLIFTLRSGDAWKRR